MARYGGHRLYGMSFFIKEKQMLNTYWKSTKFSKFDNYSHKAITDISFSFRLITLNNYIEYILRSNKVDKDQLTIIYLEILFPQLT